MPIITRINYSGDKKITALYTQQDDTYTWVAFAQDLNGDCIIEKQFTSDPLQTFFSLTRSIQSVNNMDSDGTNLFLAYTDATLFGELISLTNPLTSSTQILYPNNINEPPVDVKIDGSNIWYLTPGSISGENAKLVLFNASGVFQQTVDLTTVTNAKTMDIASGGDVWIITNQSPTKIVRVFPISGGLYDFTVTTIT